MVGIGAIDCMERSGCHSKHWTKEHQVSLAVPAYQACTMWEPSARLEDWDAVVSAYRLEDPQRVRNFARRDLPLREFEIHIDDSLRLLMTTTVGHINTESRTASPEERVPLEIALPVHDPEFTSTATNLVYCHAIVWL